MFGIVPRALWSRRVSSDDRGRIQLAHNCLLLECTDQPGHRLLIETGSGDKFDEKQRRIFGLEQTCIADVLQNNGIAPDSITHILVTHLHFDHAGGLTRRVREGQGETPDWSATPGEPVATDRVKLSFPHAKILVQKREWLDALANRSTMTRTYLRDHLDPIRDHVHLLEAPDPFPNRYLPQRDELPRTSLAQRTVEVLPGIHVFLTPGHTWAQQAIQFTDDRGRTVVFTPDCLPTIHHLGSAYNMAYDVEPYMSTVTRHWFLESAAENDWLLVLDHEPGNPCQRVRRDGKGWYTLMPDDSGSSLSPSPGTSGEGRGEGPSRVGSASADRLLSA